jgi:hypothetical protein
MNGSYSKSINTVGVSRIRKPGILPLDIYRKFSGNADMVEHYDCSMLFD